MPAADLRASVGLLEDFTAYRSDYQAMRAERPEVRAATRIERHWRSCSRAESLCERMLC